MTLRLLPMGDRDKDTEILALRHQITMLERHLGEREVRFNPSDRAVLAALLRRLPRTVLGRLRLLVRPDTVLRSHRNLLARRHLVGPESGATFARLVLVSLCFALFVSGNSCTQRPQTP